MDELMVARPSWGAFAVWTVAGVAFGFSIVVFPSLALILLVVGFVLAIVRPALFGSGVGVLAGVGLVSLYVAFVQRQGPGTVCWQTATASGCDEYLNPWPWLVVGLAMIVIAVVVQASRRRHARMPEEGPRDSVGS
jgi:hypothetical protein